MKYHIVHTTTYDYEDAVATSQHLAHLMPRSTSHQAVHTFSLHCEPGSTLCHHRTDYFGNTASYLSFEFPHRKLRLVAQSEVEIRPSPLPNPASTPPWEHVLDRCRGHQLTEDVSAGEFAYDSAHAAAAPEYREYALPSFGAERPVFEAVLDLTARIHEDFTFDPSATTTSTSVSEVFKKRRGVCQDFAHLQLACLRSVGVPARYVSGYLETLPPHGQVKLIGADASHAWVSFRCPDFGWIDVDPTNNLAPSERHITLGWGRDYHDVAPLRGILVGGGRHELSVAVDVERVCADPSSLTPGSPPPPPWTPDCWE